VATVLLAGVDPLFSRELFQLLAGHHLITIESVEEPDLVIADIARVDPGEVSDAYPTVPILGYSNHADPSSLHRGPGGGLRSHRRALGAGERRRATDLRARLACEEIARIQAGASRVSGGSLVVRARRGQCGHTDS